MRIPKTVRHHWDIRHFWTKEEEGCGVPEVTRDDLQVLRKSKIYI